jgi:hypothetical protein
MTRRSVLRGAAGAGAAGLALTALPATALAAVRAKARDDASTRDGASTRDDAGTRDDPSTRDASAHDAADDGSRDGEAVVVHLRDVRSGEMDVYRGTSHARVTDRDLAARLARASRQ